ncbi:MAG: YibE/F family protein [Sedimentisphaerales bacterium]|nr:YibE/F family protein [Sedimentisphaerales bacterium]
MEIWYRQKRDFHLVALFAALSVILYFIPSGFEQIADDKSHLAKAKVSSVDNSSLRQSLLIKTGSQNVRVEILSGKYKGQEVGVTNSLIGKMELDEIYVEGEKILIEFNVVDGKPFWAAARGKYRIDLELLLVAMFAMLLLFVAGWTGLKALLSFIFSAMMIWKVMLPLFLRGYNPILLAVAVVSILTAAIIFLVAGLTKKGAVAFLGAFSGLLLTCVLAQIFTQGLKIHGAVLTFAETLLYSGFYNLSLTKIFIAGIFLSSSGAVMDMAMDISAAMDEIKHKKPDIEKIEHIRSGLRVGRSVIGTMTTTLLLAYSGSYMCMLMLFISQAMPFRSLANLNYVAAEILNTLVGSFGLVTVAPFTAIAGGIVFGWKRKSIKSKDT